MRSLGGIPWRRFASRRWSILLTAALVAMAVPVNSAQPAYGNPVNQAAATPATSPACSVSETIQVYPGYSVSTGPTSTTTTSTSSNTCTVSTTSTSVTLSVTANMPVGVACPNGDPSGGVTWPQCAGHTEMSSTELPGVACPFSPPGTPEPVAPSFLEWWQSLNGRTSYTCSQTFPFSQYAGRVVTLGLYQEVMAPGTGSDPGNCIAEACTTYTDTFSYPVSGGPSVAFTATQSAPATDPGQYQMVSSSVPGDGTALTQNWDFGDGSTGTGVAVTHTYTKPGTYQVTLTATQGNGLSSSLTQPLVVAAPALQTDISFVNALGAVLQTVSPKDGDTVLARLTVSTTNGVGKVNGITFAGATPIAVTSAPGAAVIGMPTPSIPIPFSLAADTSTAFVFPVQVVGKGLIRLTSTPTGTDDSGATVTGTTGQRSFSVSGLSVTLTLNPATFTQTLTDAGPTPQTVTVTEVVANTDPTDTITAVTVPPPNPQRVDSGQLLSVTAITPFSASPPGSTFSGTLTPGASQTFTQTFSVLTNGKIDFTSLASGVSAGANVNGLGTARLEGDPDHLLRLQTHIVTPSAGLLPAGTPIVIQGTATNLSDTATEDVAPLIPQEVGNAGLTGFAWNGTGVDPKSMTTPGTITLGPGDSADFTLKVLTTYSEAIAGSNGIVRAKPSGGTQATLTFTPWATVHNDDGTTTTTTPAQVLADASDLTEHISIDDSIPIPTADPLAVGGGVMVGTVNGIWDAASGLVTGLIYAIPTAASTLNAVTMYQSTVWQNFTPAQRDQFASDAASAIVPVLEANATAAAQGAQALYTKADTFVLGYFTQLDNDWQVGNYAQTVASYTSLSTNALAQVAIPIALGKLATSSEAVKAVEAAQASEDATLATQTAALTGSSTVQDAAALLQTIPAGANPTLSQLANLFGISQAELDSLQALATKYNVLLTVRSRAASSLEWIQKYAAMLKPEALKIKTVSPMDVALGYDPNSLGSLVFREPPPLATFRSSGGDLADLVDSYAQQKGFTPGTSDYDSAVKRLNDRIAEWNKWDQSYTAWNKRGWIDTSFNYKGNAMNDLTDVAARGKYTGFRMVPTGQPNTYTVELLNGKLGRWVPVTGDIDPIGLTNLDGSPLSVQQHADLLTAMSQDPLLQTQHGESATYVNGGIQFILSQFKGEALVQIAPGSLSPRIVRFNAAQSVWNSATDYNLVWDGGFTDSGAQLSDTATFAPNIDVGEAAPAPPVTDPASPLPGDGAVDGPNVGRCAMTYSNAAVATPLEMTVGGVLGQVSGTNITTSALESTCFTDGPQVPVDIRPVTVTTAPTAAGQTALPVDTNSNDGVSGDFISDDRVASLRIETISSSTTTADGFRLGQQVSIDPGGPDAEIGTIAGFGSIILSAPLQYPHAAGQLIVALDAGPVTPTASTPTAPPLSVAATSQTQGGQSLAFTGDTGLPDELVLASLLIVNGSLLVASASRRRRRAHRRNPSEAALSR